MDGFTLTPAKVPHKALAFTNFVCVFFSLAEQNEVFMDVTGLRTPGNL